MKKLLCLLSVCVYMSHVQAQDDLLNSLDTDSSVVNYTTATFKSTRVINGHSIETTPKRHMDFRISHRFGRLNSGSYNFYGLDNAYIRLGFDYGITNNWMVGIGRSSEQKMYDAFTKVKLLRQSSGGRHMPVSVGLFASTAVNTLKFPQEDRSFVSRISYCSQLLIARKFNTHLSLQLTPTLLHRNRVENIGEKNTVFALGMAGRYKVSKRVALTADYYYAPANQLDVQYHNSLAVGIDIETGGHVFSLHFTNSIGMVEKQFIGETTGQWNKGDIHYGFNISRIFSFDKKARQLNNK